MVKPLHRFKVACHFVELTTNTETDDSIYIGCKNKWIAGIFIERFPYYTPDYFHCCVIKCNINHFLVLHEMDLPQSHFLVSCPNIRKL